MKSRDYTLQRDSLRLVLGNSYEICYDVTPDASRRCFPWGSGNVASVARTQPGLPAFASNVASKPVERQPEADVSGAAGKQLLRADCDRRPSIRNGNGGKELIRAGSGSQHRE